MPETIRLALRQSGTVDCGVRRLSRFSGSLFCLAVSAAKIKMAFGKPVNFLSSESGQFELGGRTIGQRAKRAKPAVRWRRLPETAGLSTKLTIADVGELDN